MKYLKRIYKYRFVLPPAIALLALLWLTTFYALESWWTKQMVISKVEIHWIKRAEARELTTEEYVCTKAWDCKVALAVAKAESGLNCTAQNVNKNGSVDLGYFQVNSIHLKKGWRAVDLLDCRKNIDYAYEIYEAQGFNPWVAYTSKKYLKFLN